MKHSISEAIQTFFGLNSNNVKLNILRYFFTLFCILFSLQFLGAQTIWDGRKILFAKADFADPALASNQDRITDSVWITRNNSGNLYNRIKETSSTKQFSPLDTEWSFGLLKDYQTLTYTSFANMHQSNPSSTINADAVMHLISEDIYIAVIMKSWSNSNRGGFSYERTTSSCNSDSTLNITTCNNYTSPSGKFWKEAGTYFDTLANAAGCDSIVTINLGLNKPDASFQKQGNNFTANTAGANYQWMDCSNGFTPISGETNMHFTATMPGSYALEVNSSSCTDTSACYVLASLDINKLNSKNIVINPNPGNGKFKVSSNQKLNNINLKIHTLLGMEVSNLFLKELREVELNLQQPNGIYILSVSNAKGLIQSYKLVKN